MGWTLYLTRRRFLFFSSGLAYHRITAITFIPVNENDLCLWILGDGIFWTSQGTGGIFTMVTE
jgi:hypothetical protein